MKYTKQLIKKANGREIIEIRGSSGTGPDRVAFRRRFKKAPEVNRFLSVELPEFVAKVRAAREAAKKAAEERARNPLLTRTFDLELDEWRLAKGAEHSPSWVANYEQYIKQFRDDEPFKGKIFGIPIAELTMDTMRFIHRELRACGNSLRTAQLKIGWLQSVLNHAVVCERIPYSPIAKFKPAKPPRPDIQFWDSSQASAFLSFAESKYPPDSPAHWVYLVYLVGLNAMLRGGEMWALKPSCLRPDFGVMRITEQWHLKAKAFRRLKGKEARNVPMSADVGKQLTDWIARRGIGPDEPIFSMDRTPVDHNNFKNRFLEVDVAKSGLPRITFHGLRHTGATGMLKAGVDIDTVSNVLGHKDIKVTMRYLHLIGEDIAEAGETFALRPMAAAVPDGEPPSPVATAGQPKARLRLVRLS